MQLLRLLSRSVLEAALLLLTQRFERKRALGLGVYGGCTRGEEEMGRAASGGGEREETRRVASASVSKRQQAKARVYTGSGETR